MIKSFWKLIWAWGIEILVQGNQVSLSCSCCHGFPRIGYFCQGSIHSQNLKLKYCLPPIFIIIIVIRNKIRIHILQVWKSPKLNKMLPLVGMVYVLVPNNNYKKKKKCFYNKEIGLFLPVTKKNIWKPLIQKTLQEH